MSRSDREKRPIPLGQRDNSFVLMDIIVFPDQYERFWRTIRGTSLFLIEGILQHEGGVTNVLWGRF
jgi:hypothetical protein